MYVFTIRDNVAEKAGNIFMLDTIGEAERQFHDALKNSQEGSLFRTHPQDFTLWMLGEFDPKTLEIKPNGQMICAGRSVADYLAPQVAA